MLSLPAARCRESPILREVVILIARYALAPGFIGMQGLMEKLINKMLLSGKA